MAEIVPVNGMSAIIKLECQHCGYNEQYEVNDIDLDTGVEFGERRAEFRSKYFTRAVLKGSVETDEMWSRVPILNESHIEYEDYLLCPQCARRYEHDELLSHRNKLRKFFMGGNDA